MRISKKVSSFKQSTTMEEAVMSKKVYIETEESIGCESCVELCPEVFGFDDDAEKAFVIMPEGGPEACVDEAIETCPGGMYSLGRVGTFTVDQDCRL
jgi:ferredoxin